MPEKTGLKNIEPQNTKLQNSEPSEPERAGSLKPQQNTAHERLLAAYRLQRRFHIAAPDMAFLLGLKPEIYCRRLQKAGLNSHAAGLPQLDIEELLIKINTELQNFSKAEGLPEKSAVEALASLAKAVKSISELSRETRAEQAGNQPEQESETGGVKPEDVREALSIINARISELRTV
ncbi:hypothetical protein [Pseudochrobactrum sp. HB0163]|uniref:hypothetical protein n=1 Tax=Pseudochrobactrum sp. HB0163 TaxID=3450708 RepID=UPI003F6DAA01